MNFIEVALVILLFAIISVPLAQRFKLTLEVFLVIGSAIISFLPGLPTIQIHPLIIFNLFLPPILFYAAYYTSLLDLKTNVRPISLLAFGLIVFTAACIAVIAKFLFPGFTWAEGFLLGAIISPTDASSATAIIKKIGAPKQLVAILEGESLINDATALIIFRFSLLTILFGPYSLTSIIQEFFYIAIGGGLIGWLIAYLGVLIIPRIRLVSAEITFTFIIAFACYIVAEHLKLSGVIATVVGGIYFGLKLPGISSSQARLQGKATWNTIIFVINGFVFTLIGLALPQIVGNLKPYSLQNLIWSGLLISVALIIIRFFWVFVGAYISRWLVPSISIKNPIHFPTLIVLSWSGMRGIVSLAAALSIPYLLTTGDAFPNRNEIILITYIVVIITLVLPSITVSDK